MRITISKMEKVASAEAAGLRADLRLMAVLSSISFVFFDFLRLFREYSADILQFVV